MIGRYHGHIAKVEQKLKKNSLVLGIYLLQGSVRRSCICYSCISVFDSLESSFLFSFVWGMINSLHITS